MKKKMLRLFAMVFVIAFVVNVVAYATGYAQTPAAAPSAPWYKALIDMALISLVPALWSAIGPIVVSWITKAVNSATTAYVPRPVQVILSALVTAIGAGLVGDPTGVATAAVAGATGQVLAATNPESLRTSAPPEN